MSDEQSVSKWIAELKLGNGEAAHHLWKLFFGPLALEARRRLRRLPTNVVGSEDIAASVFESLWSAAQAGRLEGVATRDELWWLLLTITRHKTGTHVRRELTSKRGGRLKKLRIDDRENSAAFANDLMAATPTPDYCVMVEEEYVRLLSLLRDDKLREIAVFKMEGHSNDEICDLLGISSATVTRKLRLIRSTWAKELPPWTK